MNFVREYENSIRHMITFSNRHKLFIFRILRKIFIKKFISSTTSKSIAKSFVFKHVFLIVISSRAFVNNSFWFFISIASLKFVKKIFANISSIVKNSFVYRSIKNSFANFLTLTFVDTILALTFSSKALILRRFVKLTKKKWKYYMKIVTKTCLTYFYWDKLLRH